MKLTCPNKALKSWKDLVNKYGEDKAYYYWNKYDGEIPEDLLQIVKDKVVFEKAQILIPHSKLMGLLKDIGKNYEDLTHNEIKNLIEPEVLEGLSYRIPNQGPPSNDAFEIVGILPPEMGDTMVSFKEITTKTGSDFDIDKSFLILPNFKYDEKVGKIVKISDTENSKKGLQNKRFNLTLKMLTSPEKYAQLMSPLDAPWLSDLINGNDKEKGLFPADKTKKDLFFFTGTNQLQTKSLFDNAKNLVGVIAKHMSHHNLVKHEDMSFNDYYLGKGPKVKDTVKNIMSEKDINKGYLLNPESSLLSVEVDESGNSVEESLIAYANAIVDAAKDPFITRANINQFTANTAFMLIRAGVDRKWVTAFMGQPILKDLVEEMNISEGKISEKQRDAQGNIITALDKILQKYGSNLKSKEFKKKAKDIGLRNPLTKNIEGVSSEKLISNLNNKIPELQLEILAQFLEWQEKAKDVSDLMTITSSDTTGATKNQIGATLFINKVNTVIKANKFTNLDKMMGYTLNENGEPIFSDKKMIGTYYKNSILTAKEMFKNLFLTETDAFNVSLFNIATNAGYRNLDLKDEDLANIISTELYSALLHKSPVAFSDKNEIKTLLYNKSSDINWGDIKNEISLAKELVNLKNLEVFKDNNLIQSLDVKFGINKNDPDLISLSSKSLDVDAKNNLYLDWEQLLEINPEIGKKLINYAYYSSGFKTNFGVFFEHIPVDELVKMKFDEFIKDSFKTLKENPLALHDLESQIFKHLYKNNQLVPTINNTLLKPIKIQGNTISSEYVIALESEENKDLYIGNNYNNTSEYKRFVKRIITVPAPTQYDPENVKTLTYLYQLAGYQNQNTTDEDKLKKDSKTLIYVRTNTLGYNKGLDIIKEYGNDGNTSIFEENNVTLPQVVVDFVSNVTVYPETVVTNFNENLIDFNNNKTDAEINEDLFYCRYR